MKHGNLLICGDFNLTTDLNLDTTTKKSRSTPSLQSLLHREDLFDAWRCLHANERDYTFFSNRHCSYSHIDMLLTDKWLLQQVISARIHEITWSDHAAISLSFNETGVSPSSPIWRCNNRLLQEPKTHLIISQHLQNFFISNETSVSDPHILWNAHKAVMRGIFIQLGAREKTIHYYIKYINF